MNGDLFGDLGVIHEHSQWDKAYASISAGNKAQLFSNFGCITESNFVERDRDCVIDAIAEQLALDVFTEIGPVITGERFMHPKTSSGTRNYVKVKVATAKPKVHRQAMFNVSLAPKPRPNMVRNEGRRIANVQHRRSKSLT